MTRRTWPVPVIGAAISAVLSSGLTAAYLRSTFPDVLAVDGELQLTPEQRHLAALLVAPGEPFVPDGAGKPVDGSVSGFEGLAALGFTRGWTRTWTAPDEQRVDAFLLEFADAAGARSYAGGLGQAGTLLARPRPFTVAGVPGGSGLADEVPDRAGHYTQLVVLTDGPRAVLVVFASRSAAPGATILDLAQRQYAALVAA
jgi:hypothetical protein